MLVDNHGRHIDYVRIAVTDKCNLRCFYCMPEEGIDFVKRKELLTYEETLRLVDVPVNPVNAFSSVWVLVIAPVTLGNVALMVALVRRR